MERDSSAKDGRPRRIVGMSLWSSRTGTRSRLSWRNATAVQRWRDPQSVSGHSSRPIRNELRPAGNEEIDWLPPPLGAGFTRDWIARRLQPEPLRRGQDSEPQIRKLTERQQQRKKVQDLKEGPLPPPATVLENQNDGAMEPQQLELRGER